MCSTRRVLYYYGLWPTFIQDRFRLSAKWLAFGTGRGRFTAHVVVFRLPPSSRVFSVVLPDRRIDDSDY